METFFASQQKLKAAEIAAYTVYIYVYMTVLKTSLILFATEAIMSKKLDYFELKLTLDGFFLIFFLLIYMKKIV